MPGNVTYAADAATLAAAADLLLTVPDAAKESLIGWYFQQLGAPAYARPNWDSFEEVLNDLSWCAAKRIALYHPNLPLAGDAAAQATYLAILGRAAERWAPDPAHDLVVAFHPDCEAVVARALG